MKGACLSDSPLLSTFISASSNPGAGLMFVIHVILTQCESTKLKVSATSRVSFTSVVPLPSSSPGRGFLVVSVGKELQKHQCQCYSRYCRISCCFLLRQDALQRKPNISWHKNVRETLNPKTPSCSFISLFNRVLFPAPEGPLSTTGLGPDIFLRATDGRRRGKRDLLELEVCTDQQSVQTFHRR